MKKVSLLELTAFVIVAAVASTTVNANDAALKEKVVKADEVVETNVLFTPLDTDKNGLISQQELGVNNKLLKEQFKEIDVNADQGISEQELKNYLAKVDIKINI
ncbi:hypothetical protein HII17_01400 [Thalassotalea sp. M1531]|uniref:EF-hand domain-containing protein n=1 Tax=Thalassotalea algicola TaxID=2716224 RepID=A0A7Y0L9Q3_9GAMM|nr:hypothetical protein [Thalassotalea algicola]NMP30203.1 hypothetical protein [Thalassotalea algicola]